MLLSVLDIGHNITDIQRPVADSLVYIVIVIKLKVYYNNNYISNVIICYFTGKFDYQMISYGNSYLVNYKNNVLYNILVIIDYDQMMSW